MIPKTENKKIVIAGGTGFIGRHLIRCLGSDRNDIVILTRSPGSLTGQSDFNGVRLVSWSELERDWEEELNGADALINLAGKNLAENRWTRSVKESIIKSRVDSVGVLVRAIQAVSRPPSCFIQASATGYYGKTTLKNTDESGPSGNGFIADVCRQWESGLDGLVGQNPNTSIRTVVFRLGVILGIEDGFYRRVACMVRHRIGTVLGDGRNWMSWIHIDDVMNLFLLAVTSDIVHGVYNVTAPEPVQSGDFMRNLAASWNRKLLPSPPHFILRLALGEMLDEVMLASQHIVPTRVIDIPYRFLYPDINCALSSLREACRKRKTPVSCSENTL